MVLTGSTATNMALNSPDQRAGARRRRRRIIGAAVLMTALVITGIWGLRRHRSGQRDPEPYTVTAVRQTLAGSVVATGAVQPVREVNLSPRQPGVVVSMAVDEGDQVKRGDVLVEMDGADLAIRIREKEAQLQDTRVQLDLSKAELERYEPLAAAGAFSQRDLEQLESRYQASKVAVTAAQQQLQLLLHEQEQLAVRAPFDGLVMERFAEPGGYVTPSVAASSTAGATRASLVAIGSGYEVVASVPESDMDRIYAGQPATVILDAFPSHELSALVRRIAPRADQQETVTAFDVTLDLQAGDHPEVRYGMSGDVRFAIRDLPETVVVPTVAITTQAGQPGVYLVGRDLQPRFQPVALGLSSGRNTQILDGLDAGEQVFIDWPPWAQQQRR